MSRPLVTVLERTARLLPQTSRLLPQRVALGLLLTAASAPLLAQSAPDMAILADQPVGTLSPAATATIHLRHAGALAAQQLVTGSDFQLAPGGTCRIGQHYVAADTCTVNVTFQPAYPGASRGSLGLLAADGTVLGSTALLGTGTGSFVAFTPGALTDVPLAAAGMLPMQALTTDAAGAVLLLDAAHSSLLRIDATSTVTTVSATVPAQSIALAASPDGSAYVLTGTGVVFRLSAGTWSAVPTGLTDLLPTAIAVDSSGSLLLADATRVVRIQAGSETPVAGSKTACASSTDACGDGGPAAQATFSSIRAIALDAQDNLYIADAGAYRLRRVIASTGLIETVAGTGAPCAHGTCGESAAASSATLGDLQGLTVDALGNVYLAESKRGLRRIDAASGRIRAVLPASATAAQLQTAQLAATRDGSVFLLSALDGTVSRFTTGSAALAFAQTPVGQTSTDGAQTVLLTNLGNAPLTLSAPGSGTNPSTTADFPLGSTQTCPQLSTSSAAGVLAPGDGCTLQVKFQPTVSGTLTSSVVVTNTSSALTRTNSITLRGAATAAAGIQQAGISFVALPSSLVYGQPVTLVTSVFATNSGPAPTGTVNFAEGSTLLAQNVALSSGLATDTVTLPASGPHTYTIMYSGDTNYAASNATTQINVARAGSVFTVPTLIFNQGQTASVPFYLSGQYSGTGIALPTGTVSYTFLDSTGAVISSGTASSSDRLNSVAEEVQLGTIAHGGTYTLRLSYPGDINFLPLQQDFTFTARQLSQTITFAPIQSPVTYGVSPIQLSATASSGLPVTFSVLSGPGTINGSNQLVVTGLGTIRVAANQSGNTDYTAAPQVTQDVVSVRPVGRLTWATPAPIYVGTPLSSTQLNAQATDPNGQPLAGTYTYTPPAGTVLPVGDTRLNVSFVPTDTDHYGTTPLTASVVLTVRDTVTPTLSFPGGTVLVGNPLAGALNATATNNGAAVPGSFNYTIGGNAVNAGTVLPVGTYTVVAGFTPTDTTTYRSGTATSTITVTRATPTLTLSASAGTIAPGGSVTFTAHVAGASTAPTGTVQFQAGNTSLGNITVDGNGNASVSTSGLPSGSTTITAVYSGDANYGSVTATLTQVVADFSFGLATNSASTVSVLPGRVANYTFTLAPVGSSTLAGDVTFKLTGLPGNATYTLTPTTVSAGTGTTTVKLAVTAPSTLKASVDRPVRGRAAVAIALAVLVLPFAARLRRRSAFLRKHGPLALVFLGSLLLFTAAGCGTGVGYFDQAQLSFPLTLTATSGSVSHAATVTLQVQ